MKIKVLVKTNSDTNFLKKISDTEFFASVVDKPVDNKANISVIKLLNKIFDDVRLLTGHSSKIKFFSVTNKNK